jgi:hypothetical protein
MKPHRGLYIDIPINRTALKFVRTHMDATSAVAAARTEGVVAAATAAAVAAVAAIVAMAPDANAQPTSCRRPRMRFVWCYECPCREFQNFNATAA